MNFKRVFIEKKDKYNTDKNNMFHDFKNYLNIEKISGFRLLNVYDIIGATKDEYLFIRDNILCDKNIDKLFEDKLEIENDEKYFRVEFVKGQYNQREDSLEETIRLTLKKDGIKVKNSRILIFKDIEDFELEKIKDFFINPVELKEIGLEEFTYKVEEDSNITTEWIKGFIDMNEKELKEMKKENGLGMDFEDLEFCQSYFKKEKRDPSITELKLIDTYWSDHCRHTTFMTELTEIEFVEGRYKDIIENAFKEYLKSREFVYESNKKVISLMDLATINTKEIKKKGLLDDLEESEEINAASIEIDIKVDDKDEKWLLMFKNETHNHPTEIEPFGGASTCLGGAIRDPLSGRSYVYQAMRITGSKNPLEKYEDTLKGKLPQRVISTEAMKGYSSYGNEIGVPAGYVEEIYDDGYLAKRMEVGALVAAAPKENVKRLSPIADDVVILVGGKTGKDGLGGAVGSSKGHTEDSLETGGAEVQKGNPSLERKIVRLFRKPEVAKLIKKCNDFGAGGVSVAIGELADGLYIDLDKVPVKYPGMTGSEIALSESQERMAVVIAKKDQDSFLEACQIEDVEATVVAKVTQEKDLIINYKGENIVNLSRDFLDTNGIRKKKDIVVVSPEEKDLFNSNPSFIGGKNLKEDWILNISDLNTASQKGLIEKFDHSIGCGTVVMPLGGKNRITPSEAMVAKIPVLEGHTESCSIMSYGFDPNISKWSPFHGGMYAVLEAVARVVATGGDYKKIRFSFQEYFERLDDNKEKWGKPFMALLGAFMADKELDLPSIGGKDSMSGSFEDIDVPPTLIAFAVSHDLVSNIVTQEFKEANNEVILFKNKIDENGLIDFKRLKENYSIIKDLVNRGKIKSMSSVRLGGIAKTITEMSLGNDIGFKFNEKREDLFHPLYGSIAIEVEDLELGNLEYEVLGKTLAEGVINVVEDEFKLSDISKSYIDKFEDVFSTGHRNKSEEIKSKDNKFSIKGKGKKPKVLIPIFTGTTGEYDLSKSFIKAGADVKEYVFKSLDTSNLEKSYREFANEIKGADILAFPDGSVLGDEPELGGKLTNLILREKVIKTEVEALLRREGLILGIGEGFKGLVRTGLIPYGEYRDEDLLSIVKNIDNMHKSTVEMVKNISNDSPWTSYKIVDEFELIPTSMDEGRIIIEEDMFNKMLSNNQITGQFKEDITGEKHAIEGMVSTCKKIYGRLSNPERKEVGLFKNIGHIEEDSMFKSAVDYFLINRGELK